MVQLLLGRLCLVLASWLLCLPPCSCTLQGSRAGPCAHMGTRMEPLFLALAQPWLLWGEAQMQEASLFLWLLYNNGKLRDPQGLWGEGGLLLTTHRSESAAQ